MSCVSPASASASSARVSGLRRTEPKYDFIILTTAVTRPDLHARLAPGNIRFIGAARVKWLINVDPLGNDCTVMESIENFRFLYSRMPNIDLEFLSPESHGCFFSATRRLAVRALELLDRCRTGVLWLEDDWQFARETPMRSVLQKVRWVFARLRRTSQATYCSGTLAEKGRALDALEAEGCGQWYVSLVPRTVVSFNPGIWSKAMFEKGFRGCLAGHPPSRIDDPETLCADPFNVPGACPETRVLVDPVYQDAGRLWSARAGLRKWPKNAEQLLARGSVSYDRPAVTPAAHGNTDGLNGYFAFRDFLFGTPFRMIARIHRSEGKLQLRPLLAPWFLFDLVVTRERTAEVYAWRVLRWARACPYKKTGIEISWNSPSGSAGDGSVTLVRKNEHHAISRLSTLRSPHFLWVPLQMLGAFVYLLVDSFDALTSFDRG